MKIKQIDYRARVLPSRSFVKEKLTAVEIQLTMQRCLDSIVSLKKCCSQISRLRFLSEVIRNDDEINHEH